jgi:uncharacterized protein (TIGR03435 family)
MIRAWLLASSFVLLAITAAAQSFAVASVKPSAPPTSGSMFLDYGPRPGGQWASQNATFMMILRDAYPAFSLPGQIVGPDWMNNERFDINARADGDPSPEVMNGMLRQLLADRFSLRVHTEQRELDVYALVVAREDGRAGPRLRGSAADCAAVEAERRQRVPSGEPSAARQVATKPGDRPECGMRSMMMNGMQRPRAGGMPVGAMAAVIQQTVGRPVVDHTGLNGRFDFDLQFSGTGPLTTADRADAPVSVFTALQEQLGLKLESRKEIVDVLVIDQVERPTPN